MTELVWICAHVESMNEATDYVSVPRAEWDAMTPQAQETYIGDCAIELMNQQGGCGASVVDEADVPDEFKGSSE